MLIETYTVRTDSLTVSLIIWRRFKRRMPGMAERIIALTPGLAGLGPYLPIGTVISVPIDPPQRVPVRKVVNVWD